MPGEDDELVNEGMYGKACALYLQANLARHGYNTPFVVCEDWGWWVEVSGFDFACGVGVYGMRIEGTEGLDLCVTVFPTKGKKWHWRKLRTIDNTQEVDRLHKAIRDILESDADVVVIRESEEFPLG
jgi:hypothetical protein